MEYEICYLIGESKEIDLDKIRPTVEGIIEKHKGTFLEGEFVRKKRMAYEIKNEARGTYVARRFTIPSKDEREELYPDYDIMGEINKELRFNQDILRFMIVKTDDLPPLKDLDNIEEKGKENQQNFNKDSKKDFKKVNKTEEKKEEIVIEKKEEIKEEVKIEEKKDVAPVKKEEEIKDTPKEDKPKKKAKEKEDVSLGEDDIDKKLDEILNI